MSAGHDQDRLIDDKTELSKGLQAYLTTAFRAKVKKRIAALKVVEGYDNPYLVGRSTDMRRMYPDRHFPKTVKVEGKSVNTRETTAVHEVTEWLLMHDHGLEYEDAHEVANHEERDFVKRRYGVGWKPYCKVLDPYVKRVNYERITKVPSDLDLSPFEDEKDQKHLRELRKRMKKPSRVAMREEAA